MPVHRLNKLLSLPAPEWRELLHAALLVVSFRLGLWIVPYRRLRRLADIEPRRRKSPPAGAASRIRRNITAVADFVPSATCLTQALAARALAGAAGLPSELRIGAAKGNNGEFMAHAWLVCGGEIVVGELPDLQRYSQLRQPAPADQSL